MSRTKSETDEERQSRLAAHRESDRRWRNKNPDRTRELARKRACKRRKNNPVQNRAAVARYREKNIEKIRERVKRDYKVNFGKNILRRCRHTALKKGWKFDLTLEWYYQLHKLGSALSGLPFSENGGKAYCPFVASIDRIDNDKGYTQDNCRLVLRCENMFKSTMTDEQMLVVARAIVMRAGH